MWNLKWPCIKMKWWSKWVQNLKWPHVKMEVEVKVGAGSKVAMSENKRGGQRGCRIGSGHVSKWKWWSKWVYNLK